MLTIGPYSGVIEISRPLDVASSPVLGLVITVSDGMYSTSVRLPLHIHRQYLFFIMHQTVNYQIKFFLYT